MIKGANRAREFVVAPSCTYCGETTSDATNSFRYVSQGPGPVRRVNHTVQTIYSEGDENGNVTP
jgi:hypothetical protein